MKNILIIGASSGIGRSLAMKLKEKGCSILSVSRKEPDITVDRHLFWDATSDELPKLPEMPLHGLAYCPGSILLRPFRSLKPADFRESLELNLIGAVKMIAHALPLLQAPDAASIVLFSTVAASVGMPYHAVVSASKGAIEGLGLALAAELAPKIRVNVIAPSLVATPLSSKLTNSEAKIKVAAERHPLKQIGNPETIAEIASFLLLNTSEWMTGQVLHVDGGLSSLRTS